MKGQFQEPALSFLGAQVFRRVTPQLRNVLGALLAAHEKGEELRGLDITRRTGEVGACVYPMLDKMEKEGWLRRQWVQPKGQTFSRPGRLTPKGVTVARALLKARTRRPATP